MENHRRKSRNVTPLEKTDLEARSQYRGTFGEIIDRDKLLEPNEGTVRWDWRLGGKEKVFQGKEEWKFQR